MPEAIVLDTGPPSTFARVGRLDLLQGRLFGLGVLPGEVVAELQRGVATYPELADVLKVDWLEQRPPFDRLDDLVEVERLRMALTGSALDARKNLGEAAAIRLAVDLGANIAVDDYDGANLARARHLSVRGSVTLLQEAIAMGDISCADAVKLYAEMCKVSALPVRSRQQLCG